MLAIDVANLTKKYRGNVLAVDNVSFQINDGEIFGLLGPNGAGKTTIIKVLTTLLSYTAGSVTVLGMKRPFCDGEIRESIGYVPQDVSSDPALTGFENIYISAKLHGSTGKEARAKSEEILKKMSLWEARDRIARTYSGGMIRKLEIGQAMVHRPKLLFLDEPSIGLDPGARKQVWENIRELKDDLNATIVLTTHYMEEADVLCDRIAIMNDGKIATINNPSALKKEVGQSSIIFTIKGTPPKGINYLMEKDTVVIPTDEPANDIPKYIELFRQGGCEVLSVKTKEVTLDEVFLKYAGNRLETLEHFSATQKTRRAARGHG